MHISKIKILPNRNKPWASALAKNIRSFLQKHSFKIVSRNEDLAICIGGDGTILYASHKRKLHGAVFGIGSKTSYICELRRDNWEGRILKLLRSGIYDNRVVLNAVLGKNKYDSMNDVVAHSNDFRVITIYLDIDGKKYQFEGDGVILSTPMGSSAYAYSAGGKIINPSARELEIVPICPYKRTIKPFIIRPTAKISVRCDRSWTLIIDGVKIRKVAHKEKLYVASKKGIKFLVAKII